MDSVTLGLLMTAFGLAVAFLLTLRLALGLYRRVRDLEASKQSVSTRHGQLWEQFIPFSDSYPWDPGNFRFIGSPIDGVQFEQDRVILLEFKTGKGRLSERQRRVQGLVEDGRVEFRVVRMEGG
ncbi:MAG: endonuclease [Chloroflexi bacterium]|nr:endonuclease [Chloroflexota bacterium]